jgi:membrane protein
VFLLGTELIATLRKKDVLLLKGLFDDSAELSLMHQSNYLEKLMQRYGSTYHQGDYVFKRGESTGNLYFLVQGKITIEQNSQVLRTIETGDYFGEMAMLSNTPTIADAIVVSKEADVISMHTDNMETLLLDEPKVAMKFLRQLASRLQKRDA